MLNPGNKNADWNNQSRFNNYQPENQWGNNWKNNQGNKWGDKNW